MRLLRAFARPFSRCEAAGQRQLLEELRLARAQTDATDGAGCGLGVFSAFRTDKFKESERSKDRLCKKHQQFL